MPSFFPKVKFKKREGIIFHMLLSILYIMYLLPTLIKDSCRLLLKEFVIEGSKFQIESYRFYEIIC